MRHDRCVYNLAPATGLTYTSAPARQRRAHADTAGARPEEGAAGSAPKRRIFLAQVGLLSLCGACGSEPLFPLRPGEAPPPPEPEPDLGTVPLPEADLGPVRHPTCVTPAPLDVQRLREGEALHISQTDTYLVRDSGGYMAVVARCTHASCTVSWKPADRIFECPCQGSRFAMDGKAIGGPAGAALAHRPMCRLSDGTLAIDYTQLSYDIAVRTP